MFFKHKYIVLLIGISLFFAACKRDGATQPDFGYNYFPDKIGSYVIYNVDSVFYINESVYTYQYQIKEKIESVFMDNQSRPTLRIERYFRNNTSQPWTIKDVWAANRTTTTAEKVEENVRFIKLAFPVKKNQSWNGNAQNTNDACTYTYSFFDLPRTINTIVFDSVLEVKQRDETSLIHKKYYIERYARNVGMVYKSSIDVTSQPNGIPDSGLAAFYSIPILQRIDDGLILTYTVAEYGKE